MTRFFIVTALLSAASVYAAPTSTVKKNENIAKSGQIEKAVEPWPLYVAKDAKRSEEAAQVPWPLYVAKDAKRDEEAAAPWPLYVAKDARRSKEAAEPWPLYIAKDGVAVEE
ncbi:hypothetical protein F4801DRAFT_603909 [Xylaria longipes]|nr:hypothetical protein F4801DRAFT_603909 [Xylaria longipes]